MVNLIIIQILVFVAAAAIHAYYIDAKKVLITRRQKSPLAIIEILVVFGMSIFVNQGWPIVVSLVFALPIRWIVHDLTLNIIRGKSWFRYLGDISKPTSQSDSFLRWWMRKVKTPAWFPKILVLIASFFLAGLANEYYKIWIE